MAAQDLLYRYEEELEAIERGIKPWSKPQNLEKIFRFYDMISEIDLIILVNKYDITQFWDTRAFIKRNNRIERFCSEHRISYKILDAFIPEPSIVMALKRERKNPDFQAVAWTRFIGRYANGLLERGLCNPELPFDDLLLRQLVYGFHDRVALVGASPRDCHTAYIMAGFEKFIEGVEVKSIYPRDVVPARTHALYEDHPFVGLKKDEAL